MAADGAGFRGPGARGPRLGRRARPGQAPGRARAHGSGRRRVLGVHLGLDGASEGRGPLTRRLRGGRRSRGRGHLRPRRRRSGVLRVEDVLCLRPGQQPVLSRPRGRRRRPGPRADHGRARVRDDWRRATDGLLHRADAVGAHARGPRRRAPLGPLLAPLRRLVGRGAARRALRGLGRPLRPRAGRGGGLDRGAARLHRQPAGPVPRRHLGEGDPRLRDATGGRRGRHGPGGHGRSSARQGRHDRERLLEPARADAEHDARRVAAYRRHVPAGRRGLVLLRGTRRRHAEGRRPVGLAGRGRGAARRPPGGARGGRRRGVGRPRPDRAVRLRRPQGRSRALAGAGDGATRVRSQRGRRRSRPRPGSTSWPTCPRPPPARSSASACATRRAGENPRRRRQQALWRRARTTRGRARRRHVHRGGRGAGRGGGPVGVWQVDAPQSAGRPAAAGRRHDRLRRPPAQRSARHRDGVPGVRALPVAHRPGQRGVWPGRGRRAGKRAARHRPSLHRAHRSRRLRDAAIRTSSRAACASAWASPARWPSIRPCC